MNLELIHSQCIENYTSCLMIMVLKNESQVFNYVFIVQNSKIHFVQIRFT